MVNMILKQMYGDELSTFDPAAASPMSPKSTAFGTAWYKRKSSRPEYIVASIRATRMATAGIHPNLLRTQAIRPCLTYLLAIHAVE